jgi:hypothetical protein
MNFIIVGKTNYDNDFRTLISSHKLDRVYIKNGNDIEILSNLSICESMTNSNICMFSNRLLPWISKFKNIMKILTIITAITTCYIGYKQIELSNKVQKIEIINTKK